jgi:two-component system cell cycle sensor histidine kinase/response regulator CckA
MTSTALGRLPDGRRAVLSMGVDVTERKRNEAAMHDSEERYRLLFASNPNPMWVYDLNSLMFLEVNEAAISKYGYSREEFLAMTIAEIRPPEEVPRMLAAIAAVQDASNSPGVWRHRCKDGTVIDAEVNTHGVTFEGRSARLVLANDITERLRAEEGREAAEVALRQAQKMEVVGRLAGGVAHDFNNMLSVILGYTDQAIQILPPDHELQPSLEQIMIAGKRSADLTRQLLTFSRKQVILPRVVDLNQVLADHQKMLGRLIGEHIDLRFAPADSLWPVRIDPVQVNQVLANLAVNARDAIDEVGALRVATANVTIAPEDLTTVADAEPGEYVQIVVADSGSGMDAATLEQIFEPFFTTKEEGKGTGLGLATVYGIVKQNNGFLRVESTPGMGTTFYIYLPRYAGDVDPQDIAPKSVAARGVETILIVEDEALILTLTRKALIRQGYQVLCAESPSEACRICEEHPGQIDLLLSDLIMPEMNGRELSNRIHTMRPSIRTIFMSGYTADLIASQGILEEGVDFLQKPFPMETLAAKVREVLERS